MTTDELEKLEPAACTVRSADPAGAVFGVIEERDGPGGLHPLQTCTVELMVHPGLPAYSEETELLHSDWWHSRICENSLISYEEL